MLATCTTVAKIKVVLHYKCIVLPSLDSISSKCNIGRIPLETFAADT